MIDVHLWLMKTLYEVLVDRYPLGCVMRDGQSDPCYRVSLSAIHIAHKTEAGKIDQLTAIQEADEAAIKLRSECLGQVVLKDAGCFGPTSECGAFLADLVL
jgi:hypothetical protein